MLPARVGFQHRITATTNFKLFQNFKKLLLSHFKLLQRNLGNLKFWRPHKPLALVASSTLAAICPWRLLAWETHSGSSRVLGNESESEMLRKTTGAITVRCRGGWHQQNRPKISLHAGECRSSPTAVTLSFRWPASKLKYRAGFLLPIKWRAFYRGENPGHPGASHVPAHKAPAVASPGCARLWLG